MYIDYEWHNNIVYINIYSYFVTNGDPIGSQIVPPSKYF
jgi:hypothetical protein